MHRARALVLGFILIGMLTSCAPYGHRWDCCYGCA